MKVINNFKKVISKDLRRISSHAPDAAENVTGCLTQFAGTVFLRLSN